MRPSSSPMALVALVGLLLASPAAAVVVDNLYRAEVEVAGKGEQAREKGFRDALERVIVRLAGRDDVLDDDELESLLEDPARFVQQYQYTPIDREPAETGESNDGADGSDGEGDDADSEPPSHRLQVTFAASRVDDALDERGVTVWGRQRPEILVWLAVDDGQRRYIVSADGDSRVQHQLARAAERRGLPLLLPLMDTGDRQLVDFVDIKGGFFDTVREASARYRAENLLVGYIERRGGDWSGQWHLLGIGERRAWRDTASVRGDVVEAGVAGTTQRIAAAFAGRAGEIQPVDLRVQGVGNLGAYAKVSSYLEGLARVESVAVAGVGPVEAVFRVEVQGQIAQLERAITLGDTLRSLERARDAGGALAAGDDATRAIGEGDPPDADDGFGEGASSGGARMPARQRAPIPELVYQLAR